MLMKSFVAEKEKRQVDSSREMEHPHIETASNYADRNLQQSSAEPGSRHDIC
jgi:hypothetical protein